MMTVIYPFEKETKQFSNTEHRDIYQCYIEGKYKQTHKRITDEEFYCLPKLFLSEDGVVSVVTGNQQRGGSEYIKHCKSHDCFIDRNNGVIILKKSKKPVDAFIREAIAAGISLSKVSNELDFRESRNTKRDKVLLDYATDELEKLEKVLCSA